jgi:negative regulator of genetic competence, sporulation and motility
LELIRISLDKIKISLTKAELDAYDLTVDSIDYGENRTKEAFRELFVEARERTGFETDGEKVFVQIFRAKNGGCEIFVSKIAKEKGALKEGQMRTFAFSELGDLIRSCKALMEIGFCKKSDVYIENGQFYLVLHSPCEIESGCVLEFSKELPPLNMQYIKEHFTQLRKSDAVSLFAEL